MRCFDISQKYINLIKVYNKRTNFKIKYQLEPSKIFKVKSGLRYDDALPPMLSAMLNIALEWVVKTSKETQLIEVN